MVENSCGEYTMREALADADRLLAQQFGKAEQEAAVALATFLYGVHARDEFLQREVETFAYGGPL